MKTTKFTNFSFLLLLIFASQLGFAQETQKDTSWKAGGVFSINTTQTTFSNWAAGGQNSISGTSALKLFADFDDTKIYWKNFADFQYGVVKIENQDLQKTDDKIEAQSEFGRHLSKQWALNALANFRTQFTAGYSYPNDSVAISDFMAPAYLIFSLGFTWKPNKYLTVLVSPATGKFTIVQNQDLADAGAYGVEAAEYDTSGIKIKDSENFRAEIGAYVKAHFKKEIVKNVNLESKLDLFSNYLHNPQNIDMNWETYFNFKINNFLSAQMIFHLIYDDDILIPEYKDENGDGVEEIVGSRPHLQYKQVLGIGFNLKF